jgi:hypothetical protein
MTNDLNEKENAPKLDDDFLDVVSGLMRMQRELTSSLSAVAEQQATVLANMTQPEPSTLPFLMPLFLKALDAFGLPKPASKAVAMGPRERRVVAEYELDHARLLRELEDKRAIARAEDSAATKGASATP